MVLSYNKDFQLTENFNLSEFHCKDGNRVPVEYLSNVLYIALNLQLIRNYIGSEIFINSGYRTKEHNKKIGGSKNSNHLRAMAVDIRQNVVSNCEFAGIIQKLVDSGVIANGEIIVYDNFIHYAPAFDLRIFSKIVSSGDFGVQMLNNVESFL